MSEISLFKKLLENTKYRAECAYLSVTSSVEDVVDYTSAAFMKAYGGIVGTYHAIKYAGLTIALVTAPVPTLIALAVLWMMELSIDSINSNIENELKDRRRKSEFKTVVKILKKYGRIPKTALVKTDFVKLEIDSIAGSVEGEVLAGTFKGVKLNAISDDELLMLSHSAPDSETKALLEAYISYRRKSASASIKGGS